VSDEKRELCHRCCGSGRVPLPGGMSSGFYAFMAAGCDRDDRGMPRMLCPRCGGHGRYVPAVVDEFAGADDGRES